MFKFNLNRFGGGGVTTTNIPATYADRNQFPGLNTSTQQQLDYNSLASLLSTGLLSSALNSSGFNLTTSPVAATSGGTTSQQTGLADFNTLFPENKNTKGYRQVADNYYLQGQNENELRQNIINQLQNKDATNVDGTALNASQYDSMMQNYLKLSNANNQTGSQPAYASSLSSSGRISPNWNDMYQTGIKQMNDLTNGYGAWADGLQGQLANLGPQYQDAAAENKAALSGLIGENKSTLNNLISAYNNESNALQSQYGNNMSDYSAKMNQYQQGIIPTAFTDNQQKILNDSAQTAVGSLLQGLGKSGAINSSLSRQGIGDINYNTQRTMADYYDRTLANLASQAGQQYSNINSGLDAQGNLIGNRFNNGYNTANSIFNNGLNGYNSIFSNTTSALNNAGNNLQNQFNLGQTAYGTKMSNISAPMQYTSAAQEAQDAPLTRLISNANASNQYPFNFWQQNNASWSAMNTPEQTVVTQNPDTFGSILGSLAGGIGGKLAGKWV